MDMTQTSDMKKGHKGYKTAENLVMMYTIKD